MKTKTITRFIGAAMFVVGFSFTACGGDDNDGGSGESDYSPYISKVLEYRPAPGQFVNELPRFEVGNTEEDMRKKAENSIVGKKNELITLGGFGGYVIFGFDHMIENVEGKCDFRVLGNAFGTSSNTAEGSSEPGVIMVAYDKNGNGKPDDDEWYEIAGSEYNNSTKSYQITYYKPNSPKDPVASADPSISDAEYIRWEDNQSDAGYISKLKSHTQNYFPNWINQNEMVFEGTRLPNNGVNTGTEEQYWVLTSYEYGYADNAPNTDDQSAIDINWAVDKNGNKANLKGIHFIKVYSGLNQQCGWIGETSTEVSGAIDLHLAYELGIIDKEIESILN